MDEFNPVEQPEAAPTIEAPEQEQPEQEPASFEPQPWERAIETADAQALRRHPRIAGVLGSEMQRVKAETERQLIERHAKELDERLAEAREAVAKETHGKARDDVGTRLGSLFGSTREWAEATAAEKEAFAAKLAGVDDDNAVPAFLALAADFLSSKRTAAELQRFEQAERKKWREAIRQEVLAEVLRNSEAPDLTRPKGPPVRMNIADMSDAEYDRLFPPGVPLAESIRRNLR